MRQLCLSLTLPLFLFVQAVWLPFAFSMIIIAILYAISQEIYESFHHKHKSFVLLNIRKALSDDVTWYIIGAIMFRPVLRWVQLMFPNSHVLD